MKPDEIVNDLDSLRCKTKIKDSKLSNEYFKWEHRIFAATKEIGCALNHFMTAFICRVDPLDRSTIYLDIVNKLVPFIRRRKREHIGGSWSYQTSGYNLHGEDWTLKTIQPLSMGKKPEIAIQRAEDIPQGWKRISKSLYTNDELGWFAILYHTKDGNVIVVHDENQIPVGEPISHLHELP